MTKEYQEDAENLREKSSSPYPELEKFVAWLREEVPYRKFSFEQLKEAFYAGMQCVHSRDGGQGGYIASLRHERDTLLARKAELEADLSKINQAALQSV